MTQQEEYGEVYFNTAKEIKYENIYFLIVYLSLFKVNHNLFIKIKIMCWSLGKKCCDFCEVLFF